MVSRATAVETENALAGVSVDVDSVLLTVPALDSG